MKVHQVPVGSMQNFAYVIEDAGEAVIIDPSWDLELLEDIVREEGLRTKYIINTHHHFDHTLGNSSLKESLGVPVLQHESSELEHDKSLKGGDEIEFGRAKLLVLHTPGHSADSICLVGDGKIFSGDTLFVGSCGRVDLPGGSARDLYHSIFDVLYPLDDSLVMYPGHDYGGTPVSTLGEQKAANPVMQRRTEQQFVEMMGQ